MKCIKKTSNQKNPAYFSYNSPLWNRTVSTVSPLLTSFKVFLSFFTTEKQHKQPKYPFFFDSLVKYWSEFSNALKEYASMNRYFTHCMLPRRTFLVFIYSSLILTSSRTQDLLPKHKNKGNL